MYIHWNSSVTQVLICSYNVFWLKCWTIIPSHCDPFICATEKIFADFCIFALQVESRSLAVTQTDVTNNYRNESFSKLLGLQLPSLSPEVFPLPLFCCNSWKLSRISKPATPNWCWWLWYKQKWVYSKVSLVQNDNQTREACNSHFHAYFMQIHAIWIQMLLHF